VRNQKKTNPASSVSDARSRVRPFARRVAMCRDGCADAVNSRDQTGVCVIIDES